MQDADAAALEALEADINECLSVEIEATRSKLYRLENQRGAITGRMLKSPRISIGLTPEEFSALQVLAMRCRTSISALSQLALRQMLGQARSGALPMLPPALTMDHAEPTINERIEMHEQKIAGHQARINELDASIEIDRLLDLVANHDRSIPAD